MQFVSWGEFPLWAAGTAAASKRLSVVEAERNIRFDRHQHNDQGQRSYMAGAHTSTHNETWIKRGMRACACVCMGVCLAEHTQNTMRITQ